MSTQILVGDCRETLRTIPAGSVHACVTSPPYFGLRDYGVEGQIGREPTPDAFTAELVQVFREVRRVLREDGTLWLNLGDSYAAQRGGTPMPAETLAGGLNGSGEGDALRGRGLSTRQDEANPESRTFAVAHRNARAFGLKHKDLIGIPWRVAFALQADGWYLRAACPWIKRNPMPESVRTRPATSIEYLFMLTKSAECFYDADAVKVAASTGANGSRFDTGKTAEHQLNRASAKPRQDSELRSRRTNDWFFESWQGMLPDDEGEPLAFVVNTKPYKGAHFATFPPKLVAPCVLSASPVGGMVLDPFGGSGTTAAVAKDLGRNAILCELNPEYVPLIQERIGYNPSDLI